MYTFTMKTSPSSVTFVDFRCHVVPRDIHTYSFGKNPFKSGICLLRFSHKECVKRHVQRATKTLTYEYVEREPRTFIHVKRAKRFDPVG